MSSPPLPIGVDIGTLSFSVLDPFFLIVAPPPPPPTSLDPCWPGNLAAIGATRLPGGGGGVRKRQNVV